MPGGPYNIPRDYKGEGKILYIFSTKALIFSAVGLGIGLIFFYLLKMIKLGKIGFIIMIILGVIGYAIATFKIPESKKFNFTVKAGGENIDTIILRWIKFKQKNNKIYVYKDLPNTKEEEK